MTAASACESRDPYYPERSCRKETGHDGPCAFWNDPPAASLQDDSVFAAIGTDLPFSVRVNYEMLMDFRTSDRDHVDGKYVELVDEDSYTDFRWPT